MIERMGWAGLLEWVVCGACCVHMCVLDAGFIRSFAVVIAVVRTTHRVMQRHSTTNAQIPTQNRIARIECEPVGEWMGGLLLGSTRRARLGVGWGLCPCSLAGVVVTQVRVEGGGRKRGGEEEFEFEVRAVVLGLGQGHSIPIAEFSRRVRFGSSAGRVIREILVCSTCVRPGRGGVRPKAQSEIHRPAPSTPPVMTGGGKRGLASLVCCWCVPGRLQAKG